MTFQILPTALIVLKDVKTQTFQGCCTCWIQEQLVHSAVIFPSQFCLVRLVWFGQVNSTWRRKTFPSPASIRIMTNSIFQKHTNKQNLHVNQLGFRNVPSVLKQIYQRLFCCSNESLHANQTTLPQQ